MTTFSRYAGSIGGPARDIAPVTPSDGLNLPQEAASLYIETGGTLSIMTAWGERRTVKVGDLHTFPVGVVRVYATGTTATGIHALLV